MCESAGDLELFTTEELIGEILRRNTFQGIIVQAEGSCKSQAWRGAKNFKVHWNDNLKRHEAGNILERVSHAL